MRGTTGLLGAIVFFTAGVAPVAAQQPQAWQRKWFWGAQSGAFIYKVPGSTGVQVALDAGAHWLITGKRSAMFVAFDQLIFKSNTRSLVFDGSGATGFRTVTFSGARRLQVALYAVPTDKKLQIYAGGGLAIHQITNATALGPFATSQEASTAANAVAKVDTKAFAVISGGVQYRFRERWAVYGHYQLMPSSKNFLISSTQQAITGGVRFALTTSHEDVSTAR